MNFALIVNRVTVTIRDVLITQIKSESNPNCRVILYYTGEIVMDCHVRVNLDTN